MNEVPRRCDLQRLTPAEEVILLAMRAVESLPADVRLTDAVTLLGAARESVADYVDGAERVERYVHISEKNRVVKAVVNLPWMRGWQTVEEIERAGESMMAEVDALVSERDRLRDENTKLVQAGCDGIDNALEAERREKERLRDALTIADTTGTSLHQEVMRLHRALKDCLRYAGHAEDCPGHVVPLGCNCSWVTVRSRINGALNDGERYE